MSKLVLVLVSGFAKVVHHSIYDDLSDDPLF